MAEPLGVAFVEIEPVATGFRAKTEAQLRTQLAGVGVGIPPSPATAAATKQVETHAAASSAAASAHARETAALEGKAAAAGAAAGAEGRAAAATSAHAAASTAATGQIVRQAGAMSALTAASAGLPPPLAAAAVAATALFLSVKEADAFNEAMHKIEVATHATADEMERTSDRAVQLGADLNLPLTSSVEAANAINLLVRSGLSLEEAMIAAEGALLITAASGEELSTSVQQVDRILDAFNLTADDTVLVADQIATGLRFTQGNATEFASALTSLAPAADSLGLSLQDTTTLVLQLAESGLSTTQATGSLRQAFLKLAAGGKGVNEGLREIGLSQADLRDEMGRLRPDAFVILADAMRDLNREDRLRILTQIFSRRAALGVIRIVEQEREGYIRMSEAARESGVAQDEASARTESFGGKLDDTKDSAKDLGRQVGQLTLGPLSDFLDSVNAIATAVNNTLRVIDGLADEAKDLGGALLSVVPGGDKVAGVLGEIASWGNPVTRTTKIFGFLGDAAGFAADKIGGSADDTSGVIDKMSKSVVGDLNAVGQAFLDAADKAAKLPGAAGPVAENLQTQLAVAQAAGDEDAELATLRQIRQRAQERLTRNRRRLRLGEVNQQAVQQAANDVAAADASIQAILDSRAADVAAAKADAERKADEIEADAKDRDNAFIRALQAQQQLRTERVTVAAETPGLGDDIIANRRLRTFLTRAIAETKRRIEQARAAGRDTEALNSELTSLAADRRATNREIERLREQRRQQAADERVESAQLDLQILEARVGDDPTARQTNLLVKGHQRVIAALKRAQSLTKKRSLEWKRLQLDIEKEKEAIRDLRKAGEPDAEDTRGFGQQSFEFLQSLQGFSSNLASNLIPGFATGGLVGGTTPAGTAAAKAAPTFGGPFSPTDGGTRPVTTGQGNVQITLLRQILAETKKANRTTDHPEARQQRKTGASAGDYGGGQSTAM